MTPRAALQELWAGLTEPSTGAVAGALGVALACLVLCMALLTPALVADGMLVTWPGDDYAALAADVLRSSAAPRPVVNVVLIGSSASREAIEQPHRVELDLARALGVPPRTVRLRVFTAADLAAIEALAVVEQLPDGFADLVVVEVSARNVAVCPERLRALHRAPRLPFDGARAEDFLVEAGLVTPRWRTGNYFLDHHGFFLARPDALKYLHRPPPPCPSSTRSRSCPTPQQPSGPSG